MSLVSRRKVVVVLKGYPRLSETFIAQELLGLEQAGIELAIVSLRQPTDSQHHAVHDEIKAPVYYLPEYLHESPLRVMQAVFRCLKLPGFKAAFKNFLSDLRRDLTRNRIRRFGQAAVLAAEWPEAGQWLHAHFIHTPASVAAYTSSIRGIGWTVSAHAKDIWTSPAWDLTRKLTDARWAVTCTAVGQRYLQDLTPRPSSVHLSYHGLDLKRFPDYSRQLSKQDGQQQDEPVVILSVGRAVEKKGFDVLLRALSALPATLHWQFVHVGDGTQLETLKSLAVALKIEKKITWLGAIDQSAVLVNYQQADVFALACRINDDGDRDGLPNVLVEAASQGLACVTTSVSAIPELFTHEENGLLVESEDHLGLAAALAMAIRSPQLRLKLGQAAQQQVRTTLDYHNSINHLVALFESEWLSEK